MNKLERCASSSWMGMQRVKGVTASVAALNSHSHWSLHACNAIGAVASTVDSVTMLGLVHMYTHAHTHTYMCIHTQTPHTHTKYPVAKMAYSLFFSVHNIWTNLGDVQILCGWVCKGWREWQHQSLLNSHLHWSLHLIHLIWFELFNISSC